jgi:hypothetical protein
MEICDQVGDLILAQPTIECGHGTLAIDDDLSHRLISRRQRQARND